MFTHFSKNTDLEVGLSVGGRNTLLEDTLQLCGLEVMFLHNQDNYVYDNDGFLLFMIISPRVYVDIQSLS